MLSNMAGSLILHKRIFTTIAKAKALRKYVEPIITKAKTDTTHSRRVVFAYLKDKQTIKELFGEVATKIATRPGGYTRILKTGFRKGDNAEMCMMELVDYNDNLLGVSTSNAQPQKKRTRRGGSKVKTEDQSETKATGKPETQAAVTAKKPKAEIKNTEAKKEVAKPSASVKPEEKKGDESADKEKAPKNPKKGEK